MNIVGIFRYESYLFYNTLYHYRYAYHEDVNMQLKPRCLDQIKRVMRQRAVSVDLQPEIEQACIDDLSLLCMEKTGKGDEILCLQQNLEELGDECHDAIATFTEKQAEHVELNPFIMSYCKKVSSSLQIKWTCIFTRRGLIKMFTIPYVVHRLITLTIYDIESIELQKWCLFETYFYTSNGSI